MSLSERVPLTVFDGGVAYVVLLEGDLFRMQFLCVAQLLLTEDFSDMVWNQTLTMAHRHGLIPVGPVVISAAEPEPESPEALTEGQPLVPWQRGMSDVVLVSAEVLVGAAL